MRQSAIILLILLTAALAGAQTRNQREKGVTANFDMAAYLDQLSAESREHGYKEFVYKQTPQGELRIYFAMPADCSPNDKRPVLIFFFGGGWTGGNVFSNTWVAEHFTKRGVVVGLADYRVRKRQGVMLDQCAEDARSAVRWVRANCGNLGVDPERIIAGGGSAGGHIAACTATIDAPNSDTDDTSVSCTPNAFLLYYPVASLVDGSRAFAFKRLLGEDLAKNLSPAQNVTQSWPPTVMFSGTADIELANGIVLHNKAKAAGVTFELYLAEGRGHGVARTEPRDFAWLNYATDFFTRIGAIDKQPAPEVLSGKLEKYNSEPIETIVAPPTGNPSRPRNQRGAAPGAKPAPAPIPEEAKAADSSATHIEPTLGKKGRLLLEETFDGDTLSKGWTGKTGGLRVADGTLHTSQNKKKDGRLCLFNREQPIQDALIQIDFKFVGARGINISCNPSPGELSKHGHLFSVMITQRMWNITEHNDKSDPSSRSKALSSASANFEPGKWYTLLVECRGDDVVARVEGTEPLRATSKDFRMKKPGIEFRVSGRDGEEVLFDNLRVWELK
jgi:acetyl esterase/lipase